MMNKKRFFLSTVVILSTIFFFITSNISSAEVMVYDTVAATGKAIKLKAITKKRFFPEGGRLVEFYIDKKYIAKTLSGGDGYAFLEYIPSSTGIKRIKVIAGADSNDGILLIMNKNERAVLIEIEGSLFESIFTLKPADRSTKALNRLSKRFRIVYLTTMVGVKKSRKWLKEEGFPQSVVLKWEGDSVLDELKERGIRLYAIIGSPALLSETLDIRKRFSFEETEDGVVVDDWDELLKQLK
ncbi:MAG: hypothetical protein HY752_02060 [Nitrospirae bacterium]|nr:hypothetical protein [Nitrospirota bacterium]